MEHVEQTKAHQVHNADLEYTDEATLLSATGISSTYLNKVGKALAENSYFVLVDVTTSPVTWVRISSPGVFEVFRTVASHVDGTWYDLYGDGVSTKPKLIGTDVSATIRALIVGVDSGNNAYWAYELSGLLWLSDGSTFDALDKVVHYEYDSAYDADISVSSSGDINISVRRSGGTDYGPIKWRATCIMVQQAYDD